MKKSILLLITVLMLNRSQPESGTKIMMKKLIKMGMKEEEALKTLMSLLPPTV